MCAPSAAARWRSTGSRPIWVTKIRGDGLSFFHALIDVAEEPLQLLAAERVHRHDRPVLHELAAGGSDHLFLDAHPAKQFHRALRHERRPRMYRCAAVTFHHEMLHAMAGKEQRRR
jgi:hypothetical protein